MGVNKSKNYYKNSKGTYSVIHCENYKTYSYGTFKTEAEAQRHVYFMRKFGWHPFYRNPPKNNLPKYITKNRNGKYYISRKINGRTYSFGRYTSILDATKRVKFLEDHQWNLKYANIKKPKELPKYIYKTASNNYEIRKTVNGKLRSFGIFKTIQDAEAEVELLKKEEWDYTFSWIEYTE